MTVFQKILPPTCSVNVRKCSLEYCQSHITLLWRCTILWWSWTTWQGIADLSCLVRGTTHPPSLFHSSASCVDLLMDSHMVTYNKLGRSPPSWKQYGQGVQPGKGCLAVTLLALRWHVSRLTWNPPRRKLLTPADTSPLTRFVGPISPHLLTCIPQLFRVLLISTVQCYYLESSNYAVVSFHHRFLFPTDRVTQ
jgi:hypothetical protein